MCWAGLFQVGWVRKPSVAVQFLGWSLEPGLGRSSEGCILCRLARSSFASLERAIASSIGLRAVFLRSSEISFARARILSLERGPGLQTCSIAFLARASFSSLDRGFRVSGRSSDQVCTRSSLSGLHRQQRVSEQSLIHLQIPKP